MSDLIRRDDLLGLYVLKDKYYNDYVVPYTVVIQNIKDMTAVDAVEVTYCDQCSNHGHCIPEDTFRLAGVERPFCCVGGRREENEID